MEQKQDKTPRRQGKKRHWIWIPVLAAAVGAGTLLHYLDIPHITVRQGNGNVVITIGAENKRPQDTQKKPEDTHNTQNKPERSLWDETMTLEKFCREATPSMVTVLDAQEEDFGIVVSRNGYIVTCARTVTEESDIFVRLSDGQEYTARTVGQDENGKMMLLKIDATELTPVRFTGGSRHESQPVEAMGLTVDEIPHRARIFFSLPYGVHVQEVAEGSAAMFCGLRPGDIITATDGIAIRSPQDFDPVGKTEVKLTVFRDGVYEEIVLKNS